MPADGWGVFALLFQWLILVYVLGLVIYCGIWFIARVVEGGEWARRARRRRRDRLK